MKHNFFRIGSSALMAHLLVGGVVFLGGCGVFETEEEPMPQGAYKPAASPDKVKSPAGTPEVDIKGSDPVLVTAPLEPAKTPSVQPPAPTAGKKASATVVQAPKTSSTYTVQKGDSYWKIAKKHGVSVQALLAANHADVSQKLMIGQKIVIPGKTAAAASASKPAAKSAAKATAKIPTDGKYKVRKGDSFYKIAHRFGVRATDLAAANNMQLTDPLYEGKTIVIPKAGTKPAAKSAKTSTKAAKASAKKEAAAATPKVPALDEEPVAPVIPETPAAPAAAPAASAAAPAATEASTPTAPAAAPAVGYSCEIKEDSKVEDVIRNFGCTVEEFRALNPSIPANGVVKAGTKVNLP